MNQRPALNPVSPQVDARRAGAKRRRRPEQLATRSSMALEALCFAIVRRLPGMGQIRSVQVLEIVDDAQGRNWQAGEIDPPPDFADRQRVDAALESWRHRFKLAVNK